MSPGGKLELVVSPDAMVGTPKKLNIDPVILCALT